MDIGVIVGASPNFGIGVMVGGNWYADLGVIVGRNPGAEDTSPPSGVGKASNTVSASTHPTHASAANIPVNKILMRSLYPVGKVKAPGLPWQTRRSLLRSPA